MMVGKDEELGLSLSLSFPSENNGGSMHHRRLRSRSWTEAGFTSSDRRDEACTRKGIDVNCLPETAEAAVSSPNSTVSTDEEDADNARKKLRLSKDQSAVLEDSFKEHNTLNPKQKMGLAKRLGLRPRQVEVWFQNRRARTKLKQTEVDCEFLKRCCDNLTEENRRLQKEVQELRVLKLSPQLYMQMTPPTTLTMCPSCERVALPSPSPFAPSAAARPRPIPFNHNHWPPALDALPSTS